MGIDHDMRLALDVTHPGWSFGVRFSHAASRRTEIITKDLMVMSRLRFRDAAEARLHVRAIIVVVSTCTMAVSACSVLEPSNAVVSQPTARHGTSVVKPQGVSSSSPSESSAPLAGLTVG